MAGETSVAMTVGADRTYTGTYQANDNVTFVVTFKKAIVSGYTISFVKDAGEGRMEVLDSNSETVEDGSSVSAGEVMTVRVFPANGYVPEYVKVNGTSIKVSKVVFSNPIRYEGQFTMKAENAVINYAFKKADPKPVKVKMTIQAEGGKFVVLNEGLNIEETEDQINIKDVPVGTKLQFKLVPNEGYALKMLTYGFPPLDITSKAVDQKTVEYVLDLPGSTYMFTAEFAKKDELVTVNYMTPENGIFTIEKNGGSTNVPSGSNVTKGSTLTLTAVANEGYELDKVMAGETSVAMTAGADRTYMGSYKAEADVTFVATFKEAASPEPDAFKITHNVIGNGTLEFTDSEGEKIEDLNNVPANTEVSIDAIPKNALKDRLKSLKLTMGGEVTNFKVEDWDFSFTITADAHVEAVFEDVVTVKYSAPSNGTFSVKNGEANVESGYLVTKGSTLTLTAVANEGYELDKVMAGETSVAMTAGADRTYTGTYQANASVTFVVTFKKTEQPQEKVTVTYKNGSDAVVTGSTVDKGSTLSLTAVADEGYELDKVMAGEISVAMTAGADRTYTGTYQADANVTFVVTFKEKVIETVTINYAAPDHGAFTVKNGEADVANGSTVEKGSTLSLTAVANEGYKLDKVMVGQTEVTMTLGSDRTYTGTYKADADVTFVATFKAHSSQMFTVTIKESDNGVITLKKKGGEDIASGAQVEEGMVVSVVSTPNEGYILKELKANEEDILASKEFVVSANTEVSAVFSRGYKITLKECENGKVVILNKGIDPNAVPKQTILFVRAIPDAGYRLKTLHIGQLSSAKEIYSFYVSKSLEIYAEFEQGEPAAPEDGFLLEPEIEGQGAIAIEVDGEEYNRFPVLDLDEDKSCAIRVTPAAGWKLAELTANGVDVLEVKTFKVKLGENKIFAKFIPGEGTKYTVTIAPTENGTIALKDRTGKDIASGSQVFAGTELVVVDTPADKYKLDKLMVGEEDITRTKKFVVNADVTVRAVFVNDGASETVAAFGLRVYPNPASDYVLVQGEALANVQLISLDGRVVFATLADAEGFVRIDLASIANGTYVLVVNDKATKLVVK
ncbi:T9SS type A sorting domain-containing protein [Porphyromonas crevioricanis]|nr:T9SS type A sorting domain-containing protein [Porphyromonas crevioricanis]